MKTQEIIKVQLLIEEKQIMIVACRQQNCNFINIRCSVLIHLLTHVTPSPEYPVWHVQWNDPLLFVQLESKWQLCARCWYLSDRRSGAHSSTSEITHIFLRDGERTLPSFCNTQLFHPQIEQFFWCYEYASLQYKKIFRKVSIIIRFWFSWFWFDFDFVEARKAKLAKDTNN